MTYSLYAAQRIITNRWVLYDGDWWLAAGFGFHRVPAWDREVPSARNKSFSENFIPWPNPDGTMIPANIAVTPNAGDITVIANANGLF